VVVETVSEGVGGGRLDVRRVSEGEVLDDASATETGPIAKMDQTPEVLPIAFRLALQSRDRLLTSELLTDMPVAVSFRSVLSSEGSRSKASEPMPLPSDWA